MGRWGRRWKWRGGGGDDDDDDAVGWRAGVAITYA